MFFMLQRCCTVHVLPAPWDQGLQYWILLLLCVMPGCSERLPNGTHLPMQVAEKVGAHVTEVKNVIIWGNHSSSQFPDVAHGSVGGTPIKEAVKDDAWLKGDFITTVQQRGAAIIKVGFGSHKAGDLSLCGLFSSQ